MATIVTRSGKGSPLTHAEVDANFENLNSDKAEVSSLATVATTGAYADLSGTPTLGTAAAADTTDFVAQTSATGAAVIPTGTEAQRPTPATGQLRFNTDAGTFEGYDGTQWGAIAGGGGETSFLQYEYTATAAQTTFSGVDDNAATLSYTVNNIIVTLNGVVLDNGGDYTATNGTSVVLTSGAAAGDLLQVIAFKSFTVADMVPASTGGTFAGNVAVNGNLTVDTNTLFVDAANNRVGVGTASPTRVLHLSASGTESAIRLDNTVSGRPFIITYDDSQNLEFINSSDAGYIAFKNGTGAGTERVRIDSSGNVGIGTSSPLGKLDLGATTGQKLQLYANNFDRYGLGVEGGEWRAYAPPSAVMTFGSVSSADGVTFSERMRLDSSGRFLIGTTSNTPVTSNVYGVTIGDNSGGSVAAGVIQASANGNAAVIINRGSDDGNLVNFYQAGTVEGTISVSGSTVSYNGGHLARWSQTADNARIDLLKGTVMTNLDQMAVWTHDTTYWTEEDDLPEGVEVGDVKREAYVEGNEQLNCMAVSSVEGDPNVAGVFVNWDNDDDEYTNDMNVAMTGDMIIRIGAGVTVQRGDLLMSAGDGTAKPQGDDIIRSKTIAKVTSTHVTCTYEDGSYCVPCVLMAC